MKKTIMTLSFMILIAFTLVACNSNKSNPEAAKNSNTTNASPVSAEIQNKQDILENTQAQSQQQEKQQQPQASTEIQPKKQIEYAFTMDNQQPEKLYINVVKETKSNLDIALQSLTNKDIVNAILEAKKRGVAVRLITDQQEAKNTVQIARLRQFKAAGIPIKVNAHKGLMHLKTTIADKSILTTGSFNYSASAAAKNDEDLVVIYDSKIAQEWSAEFQKMWNDKTNFMDWK